MPPTKPDPVLAARIVTAGAWVMIIGGGLLAVSAIVLLVFVYGFLPNGGVFMPGPLILLGGMGLFGTLMLIKGRSRLKRLQQGRPIG